MIYVGPFIVRSSSMYGLSYLWHRQTFLWTNGYRCFTRDTKKLIQ